MFGSRQPPYFGEPRWTSNIRWLQPTEWSQNPAELPSAHLQCVVVTPQRRFHTFHTRDLTHAGVNKNGFWHLRRVGQIIVFENQSQRVGQRPRLPSPYLQHNKAPNCTGIQFVHGFCQPVNKPGENIESAVALHWRGYMVEYKKTWRGRNGFNRVSNNNYKNIVMAIMYQADKKLYIEKKSLKLSVVCKNDLIISVSRRRRTSVSHYNEAWLSICDIVLQYRLQKSDEILFLYQNMKYFLHYTNYTVGKTNRWHAGLFFFFLTAKCRLLYIFQFCNCNNIVNLYLLYLLQDPKLIWNCHANALFTKRKNNAMGF